MKAIILGAGIGSRLGLTDIPKPMYKIQGVPILEHNLILLKKNGIIDICINIHHKGYVIKNYFGDGSRWNVKITYSEEKELLGTSGAVKNVEWFWDSSPFFVVYGDNYTDIDLAGMFEFHKKFNSIATIALYDLKKVKNSNIAGGIVKLGQNNNVTSFIEGMGNTQDGYVNAGVYVLESKILDMIPENIPSDFGKDIFPELLKKKIPIGGYMTCGFVFAIDTKEALGKTIKRINDKT